MYAMMGKQGIDGALWSAEASLGRSSAGSLTADDPMTFQAGRDA